MKKLIIALIVLAIAVVACLTTWQSRIRVTNTNDKPVVKIGVILPLTGNSAFAGIPVQKSINLALRDIQKEQNLKYNYELIYADTDNSQKQAILATNRLKSMDGVNAIISMWSPAGLVISPFAEQNKILHLGCSWGYDVAKGHYNFNHATFAEEQTAALIKQLKKRGIDRIGFIWDNEKSQYELIDYLKQELAKNNINIVFDNPIVRGTTDFRMEIAKMKGKDAQIILMLMLPPGMDMFVKQKREAGYNVPITSIEYLSYNAKLFEGYWYIGDAVGSDEFGRYAKQEIGEDLTSCMANLYDGLKMVIEGFENVPANQGSIPDNEDVAKFMLNNRNFKSVMGNIYIDDEGNVHTETVVKQIIDGHPVQIEE